MATPKVYTPEEIARNRQAMLDRVRGGTEEQVALRENEARNRYRSFLADQGQDPDTIGAARINRSNDGNVWASNLMSSSDQDMRNYYLNQLHAAQTTAPALSIPSIDQEYDAINAANQIAGMRNREDIAARRMAFRNPLESALILNSLRRERIGESGLGRSAEANRAYFLNRLGGAYDWRQRLFNSNGYAE